MKRLFVVPVSAPYRVRCVDANEYDRTGALCVVDDPKRRTDEGMEHRDVPSAMREARERAKRYSDSSAIQVWS